MVGLEVNVWEGQIMNKIMTLVFLQYFFLLFANYNTINVASSYNYKLGTAAFVV